MGGVSLSVPGKLILMGEHAAVYSRPALVAALDLRLRLQLSAASQPGVELDLADLKHRERVSWRAILDYTRRIRRRWTEYSQDPEGLSFQEVRGEDPAHVVKLALGEAQEFLGDEEGPALRLAIQSEVPVGAGFGSSAATSVAVLSAYLLCRGRAVREEVMDGLALEVERRQHGQPSGIDSATVLRGGVLWASRAPGGPLALVPLANPGSVLLNFRIFHTGRPREATGTVVAHVRSRAAARGARFEQVLERMEGATRALRLQMTALSETGSGSASPDSQQVMEAVREFEAGLEELGVVPEEVRRLIRQVEAKGGAAKVSGAGALSGPGAGSLLVYHPVPDEIRTWGFLQPYPETSARLGAAGVLHEETPCRQ